MSDIPFNQIPAGSTLVVPGFFAEVDASQAAQTDDPGRVLYMGQMLATGNAVAGQVYPIATVDQAKALFGTGSQLVAMLRAHRRTDPFGLLFAVGLADAGGAVKASMSITVTAAPTGPGQIPLWIAGIAVPVVLAGTESINATATAIAAAITNFVDPGQQYDLPVTATVLNAVVTLTAINGGTLGNDIDVRNGWLGAIGGEVQPPSLALTLSSPALTGGATDPTVTAAFAALGDVTYDFIGAPYSDAANLDAIDAAMGLINNGRWSYTRQMWGHVYAAKRATVGTAQTFGLTRNGPFVSTFDVYGTPSPIWEWLAVAVGQAAVVLRNDPGRPVTELPLPGVKVPPLGSTGRFSQTERNTLLLSGVSTIKIGADNVPYIDRIVSMYRVNALGQSDQAWRGVEKHYVLMRFLRRLQAAWRAAFPRAKLRPDGQRVSAGDNIVTPSIGKAMLVAEMRRMESDGLLSDVDSAIPFLRLQINSQNPDRMDIVLPPPLIGQLFTTAVLVQFRIMQQTVVR